MNGVGLGLVFTNVCTLILLIASMRSTRLWINAGQTQIAKEIEESHPLPAPATPEKAPHVHRIEVEISGGRSEGRLNGDITFSGVCDAREGASCRMWCNDPDCREEAIESHGSHVLVDQGECGVIESLNADPSYIPEAYAGGRTPLRSGPIDLKQDIDGVTWQYAEEPNTEAHHLVEYGRRLVAQGHSLVYYADRLTKYHGSLNELSEVLMGLADTPEPPTSDTTGPSLPDCADDCRHRCPECRLGLGTHLTCDQLCDHHTSAAKQ